jgi:biopolymer transport protein ExbB
MDNLTEELARLWSEALRVWVGGGWCMVPIAGIAILMFHLGLRIRFRFADKGFQSVPENVWRRWLRIPEDREGPIGRLLHSVAGIQTVPQMALAFEELRATELAPFRRDLRVMKVCVAAAPLLGLLGTVTGMLGTFKALAGGAGGDQTMGQVAKGISEALITTETGLIVALPGVFFGYLLSRQFDAYQSFLAHVETVCTQDLYKRLASRRREPAA